MVIPGQCFIYDHTKIFRVVLLYEYVAMKSVLFVFGVTGSGYVEYTTFLGMELHLPCFMPICLDLVERLLCQYHWILSCR